MNSSFFFAVMIAFTSTLATSHSARADANQRSDKPHASFEEKDRVTDGYLKIFGRGIENRKTGDVIALACVGKNLTNLSDPSCSSLRYVYFIANEKAAYYAGHEVKVETKGIASETEIQSTVLELKRDFESYRKDSNQGRRGAYVTTLAIAGWAGGGVWAYHKDKELSKNGGEGLSGSAIILPLTAGVAFVAAMTYLGMKTYDPKTPDSSSISDAMVNQDGWNWSVKPEKISKRNFKIFTRYLHIRMDY